MNKQAIWNFWAWRYEHLWVQKYSLEPTRREILEYLKKLLQTGRKYRILDVGCGTGQLLKEIAAHFTDCELELTGIDFSREMIGRAASMGKDIRYLQLDVSEISSFSQAFDIFICTHSFPYYEKQENVIKQFKSFLKPGGYLLLAQASQNTLYDSVVMFFVKMTTGKAKYPSIKTVLENTKEYFQCENVIKIKERFFMPSIYFFVLKKGNEDECITNKA